MVATCGGYINAGYFDLWNKELWEIIELIEIVTDLNKPPNQSNLGDLL